MGKQENRTMPTIRDRFLGPPIPKYRRHKASGQAVVTLNGDDFYLGPHGSKVSHLEYDRVVGEWIQNGRRPSRGNASDLAVVEIINAYRKFADGYYVKNGQRTREAEIITHTLKRFVQPLYGRVLAVDFGPCALKNVREKMLEAGHSRSVINKNVDRIRRMFRWAASEEMIPVTVFQALSTLPGLRKGRTTAREPKPVLPVAESLVEATLPHLPKIVADMVRFERLTGCRPGEVCQLRPGDIDRTREVWAYRPGSHKTEHHDRERVIFVGPKAQAVILPYLLRDAAAYCFSPAESMQGMRDARRTARRTPLHYGNRPGTNRKVRPQRTPKVQYTKDSYARAIRRGVDKANKTILEDAKEFQIDNPVLLAYWAPNRLRHTRATEVRRTYGLEAAQVILGHAKADVTQVYAERDMALAAKIMGEVG
jgi:integrase